MASFVPAQFSSLGSNFNFESLRAGDNIGHLKTRFSKLRPPQDFFDVKRFSRPSSIFELQNRISFNLNYFSSNYLLALAVVSVYTLLSNLWLLFVLVFLTAGSFGISKLNGGDLNLKFVSLTTSQLYTGLFCIGAPIFIFSSPISTLIWAISASAFAILGHAALIDKPVEVAFNETV